MKRIISYCLAVFALAVTTSCENDVAFTGDQTEPKMVINTVFTAGETPRVFIGRSAFFLSSASATWLTDAVVKLYVNGVFAEQLVGGDSPEQTGIASYYYVGTTIFAHGDRVRIEAVSPEFPDKVWSEVVIPSPVAINSAKVSQAVNDSTEERLRGKFQICIDDPGENDDYYWLSVNQSNAAQDNPNWGMEWEDVEYTDPVFADAMNSLGLFGGDNENDGSAWFDDTAIDGAHDYPLSVTFNTYTGNVQGDLHMRFAVSYCHIDSNLFKYLKSYRQSNNTELFSEPVRIHTNVVGGMGIVGARSADAPINSPSGHYFEFDLPL